ncbi:MAG: DNA polymerase III subunit delta [Candidatus Nomurabacteria bacterium]|jgi:DNA polymerase III delta subunit|nr:DNA polymerase III subunit delta [Candidatus Nomurabacteria bacterium]
MIYFYYGENDFLLRRQIATDVASFSKKHGDEAVSKINASDVSFEKLFSEIANINMFAPRRLAVLSGLENEKNLWEKLNENLSRIPDEITLIVAMIKPDKRTKMFKDLKKVAESKEFLNPKAFEMAKFVLEEASLRRVEIRREAVQKLIEITSGDGENQLARIASEIAKMSALNKVISVEMVEKMVEPDVSANVFVILEKAIAGKRDEIKKELQILQESGENANKFFGLLVSQIFALAAAVFGGDDMADLKINPFQLKNASDLSYKLGTQSEREKRVKAIVAHMAEIDAKMKLSNANNAWILVETMLMTL